jgi:hypothetical protein
MPLPSPLCHRLEATVRTWPGADAHHVYPASTLHVTVRNIATIGQSEDALNQVVGLLETAPPITLVLSGFGATSHSVFVRVFDRDGSLVALRKRLVPLTGASPLWQRRRLGVVNVLRYRSPEAGALVRAATSTRFGPAELVLDRAEIVRTDRLFSAGSTTMLRQVAFRRSR